MASSIGAPSPCSAPSPRTLAGMPGSPGRRVRGRDRRVPRRGAGPAARILTLTAGAAHARTLRCGVLTPTDPLRDHRRAKAAPPSVDRGRECGDQRAGFAGEITIAPYFSDKVWLALTVRRNNRSQANAHPRHPLRHEHCDPGRLRRDGPQPHPTPHRSGWPAFEHRHHVRGDRAGVHWAVRRQLVAKLARFPARKRHICRGMGRRLVVLFAAVPHPSAPGPQHSRQRHPRIGPVAH
jgi:hypothetical protein